jgi:hypothetical protein
VGAAGPKRQQRQTADAATAGRAQEMHVVTDTGQTCERV